MPESKKRQARHPRRQDGRPGSRIDPRAPWKPSWWVLWGFVTVIGELILIALVRGSIHLSTTQIVVIAICIPFVAHLLVSAFRTVLILISSR